MATSSPTAAPSLFAPAGSGSQPAANERHVEARSLLDLMYDGFYMLFLLKNRNAPVDAEQFRERVKHFLADFERGSARLNTSAEDTYLAKYAFCAVTDEVVLSSSFNIRDAWERQPLQLALFGEQLAGEHFFTKLETLRQQGAAKVQVLEVFHMCLLLGFQGKYLIEGSEKLSYLSARLGDEIAGFKGKRTSFAPRWAPPDSVANRLKTEVPLWAVASVFALLALTAFIGLRAWLDRGTTRALASYDNVVRLAPAQASLTITLP